jgi:hypothetical protein
MKPAVKLWDLIKPPFKTNMTGCIFDQNGFVCGKVQGWGAFQGYENGPVLLVDLRKFMVDAMNEKFERMKEAGK